MLKTNRIGLTTTVMTLILGGTGLMTALAEQDKTALGDDDVKQLVLLMDTDKSGKVSRKEFMDFMSAEFDRLDKDKSGELDVKELAQSRLRASGQVRVKR